MRSVHQNVPCVSIPVPHRLSMERPLIKGFAGNARLLAPVGADGFSPVTFAERSAPTMGDSTVRLPCRLLSSLLFFPTSRCLHLQQLESACPSSPARTNEWITRGLVRLVVPPRSKDICLNVPPGILHGEGRKKIRSFRSLCL